MPILSFWNLVLFSSGFECVILKGGRRLCGTGAALANAPLVQNKSYFEVKIQQGGTWGVGLATERCPLDKVPLGTDTYNWVLRSDGNVCHDGDILYTACPKPKEGDVVVSLLSDSLTFLPEGLGGCQQVCTLMSISWHTLVICWWT